MPLLATLKNRQVVTAMLVAPLLAVLAWFGVGWLSGDTSATPSIAQPGEAYPLIERSGCRYGGGRCVLANEDVELELSVGDDQWARIVSTVPLQSLMVALRSWPDQMPRSAEPVSDAGVEWRVHLDGQPALDDALRLAAVAGGAAYFGEASLRFLGSRDS